ncbi:MAG TPA: DUF1588 domain-containing protein [Polyangiaceae bacterium]|nr:DUF1588 domain-containing protein [Polyangiaceae bacterium]
MRPRCWPCALVLVTACGSGGTPEPLSRATSGRGGVDSVGTAGAGGSGNATNPTSFQLSCAAPELGKPVLRVLNRDQFTRTVRDIFPQVSGMWSSTLPTDPQSDAGFDNDANTVVGPQLAQALLDTASAVAAAVTGPALATILPCSTTNADRACAEQFIDQYGRRLFRRALTAVERDRYLNYFDSAVKKADFKTALKWLTVGLIQSPNAVYRSEIGAVTGDGRQLDRNELVTELAYTYTGTTPSESLLAQAEQQTQLDVPALAKSLLASDAGNATLQRFFESYLDYPRVASIEREGIAQWGAVRGPMIQETRSFIDQIVIRNGGGLKELLTSATSNPSRDLAAYYGFDPPEADNASTPRPSGRGIGLLAQGSILASRALPNGSSPTQRGLLVYTRLLCNAKRKPPGNVPGIPNPVPGQSTTRQRYEAQHAANPPCNTCHRLFDPIGFGFEHFDEGGRYRNTDGGLSIDTVSEVPTDSGTPLFQFLDQESLARGLAEEAVVYQCFAAYLATYAFGTSDACLGASRVADLQAGTLGVADYYSSLAAEPHFTRRSSR